MKNQRQALLWVTVLFVWLVGAPAMAQDEIFSDGFESGDTSRWSDVEGSVADVLRFSDVDVRDPHLFVDVPFIGCTDVTDNGVAGVVPSFNEWIEEAITTDSDSDGLLDSSYVMVFKPFSPEIIDGSMRIAEADCTEPIGTTTCEPTAGADSATMTYDGYPGGPCLQPVAGTTSGYSPVVGEPVAPCFVTMPGSFVINLNGLLLPLTTLQISGTTDHVPPTMFTDGLVMGFLSEADADAATIPDDLPLIGGQPLSSILPGGTNCCAAGDDRDSWGGEMGWWFYFNFVADAVSYED